MKKILCFMMMLNLSLYAHFQLIYTPDIALNKAQNIPLRLIFAHPFTDELTMAMGLGEDGKIQAINDFYVLYKDTKIDLRSSLKAIDIKGSNSVGKGYESEFRARKMGDYVFVLDPAPYWDKEEKRYIHQIVKLIANIGSMPTNWDQELGLKSEIVPLNKPYSIWAGSTFSGIVKSNGKVVPNAVIEVEYLNHDIDVKNNVISKTAHFKAPHQSFITQTIKADSNGKFTFGIPKSGWWGFAALGSGSDKEYKGKELEQSGVIWVKALDMK